MIKSISNNKSKSLSQFIWKNEGFFEGCDVIGIFVCVCVCLYVSVYIKGPKFGVYWKNK